MTESRYPLRYLPPTLNPKDRKKQVAMLRKSRRLYKKVQYFTRKRLHTFKSRRSHHLKNAQQLYGITESTPSTLLSRRSGCPLKTLRAIVRKGEGAYYSSGSRPNQTARSWGLARLASALTGGKAAAVDFHLLQSCDHSKPAYKKALRVKGRGQRSTRKVRV